MIRIHGLPNCDSTRNAIKALRENGNNPEFRDLRDAPPTREEIDRWLTALGPGLLNKASTTWRGLTDAEKNHDPAELLTQNPTLVKRPIIESEDRLTLGWKPDVRAQWLG